MNAKARAFVPQPAQKITSVAIPQHMTYLPEYYSYYNQDYYGEYYQDPYYDEYEPPGNKLDAKKAKKQRLKAEKEEKIKQIEVQAKTNKAKYSATEPIFNIADVSYDIIMEKLGTYMIF